MPTEHSEDDVANALRGLAKKTDEPVEEATDEAAVEPEETTEELAAEAPEEVAEEVVETGSDDLDSLKTRLAEREAAITRYEEQLRAVQTRGAQSLETVRRQALRYASERDKARQVLEKALSADGVDKAEAERLLGEIRSGYNPASTNYSPPVQPEVAGEDDRALTINQFLNDKMMTDDDAHKFGEFIRNPANLTDADHRINDTYSLLSVLEPRWRASLSNTKPSDAVRAVKTVANAQRRAAKVAAAGAGTSGTKVGKRTPTQKSPRLSDEQLGGLIKEMWENR